MGITSLTLACLLLAAGPAQTSDVVPITKRNFKIPILIEPARRPGIKLLKLYVSRDQGATWEEAGNRTSDQDHFAYYAPADGIYWFTVSVVDQQNNEQPPSPHKVAPNQKILVDSTLPDVKFTAADRQGQDVSVSWEIREDNVDLESFRLEYRPADAPATALWYAVPAARELSGTARFRVENPAAIVVRLEVKDQAGNLGTQQKELAGPPVERPLTAAAPVPPPPAPVAVAPPPQPQPVAPPPPAPMPVASAQPMPSMERPPLPLPGSSPLGGNPLAAAAAAPAGAETTQRVVAWSPNIDPGPAASALPGAPTRGLPNALIVNDPVINLEYEVQAGPSGVKKVEVWLTEDDGRTWRHHADDNDNRTPVTVTLPGQGVFGVRLVTYSGAELSEGPPHPGDVPDMRMEVDLTPPVVQLYEPKPENGRPEVLALGWSCTDRNLGTRPVTLEFADKPDGPWQAIASNLPPTGSYSWQPPRGLYFVHLRAIAVDTAGNRSIAQTRDPILVDLNKTRGRILGVAPPVKKIAATPPPAAPATPPAPAPAPSNITPTSAMMPAPAPMAPPPPAPVPVMAPPPAPVTSYSSPVAAPAPVHAPLPSPASLPPAEVQPHAEAPPPAAPGALSLDGTR